MGNFFKTALVKIIFELTHYPQFGLRQLERLVTAFNLLEGVRLERDADGLVVKCPSAMGVLGFGVPALVYKNPPLLAAEWMVGTTP